MSIDKESPVEVQVEAILEKIKANASRIKELGQWPGYMGEESLAERVPKQGDTDAPGFDAGIACALDLITRDKQKLAATLHGAYTPEAVQQVRDEIKNTDPDSETCWWLAACSICEEGDVDQKKFLGQIENFKALVEDPARRLQTAKKEFEKMVSLFNLNQELGGVAYGDQDGCMQGSYIAGHSFAVQRHDGYGLYFIGTYNKTLGLEQFTWSEEKNDKGRAKSGPVFGSKQFVKCASKEELLRALEIVRANFITAEKVDK